MPEHDPQTWLRDPSDIDWIEEEAWRLIAVNDWTATPQLLFALKAKLEEEAKQEPNGS